MKKKYEALIFDLDGTLIDSKKDISVATNETIAHMGGGRLPEETIATFVGRGVKDLIRDALKGSRGPVQEQEALRFFESYYFEHCLDHTRLFPGARETLNELALRGVKFAVLTNKPQTYTDKILSGLGIAGMFGMVVGAEAGFPNKPDRAGGNAILAKLIVSAERALMVGDSIVDLQTAENVGMDCALSLNGFSTREEILKLKARADYLYEEIPFLRDLA
jgi:phosphoglycolate phosphatase